MADNPIPVLIVPTIKNFTNELRIYNFTLSFRPSSSFPSLSANGGFLLLFANGGKIDGHFELLPFSFAWSGSFSVHDESNLSSPWALLRVVPNLGIQRFAVVSHLKYFTHGRLCFVLAFYFPYATPYIQLSKNKVYINLNILLTPTEIHLPFHWYEKQLRV